MASFYVAADALIERNGEYLMIKEGKERCRGTWNIPGGAVEHGENPAEAVKREVWEETGLEVEEVKGLLGVAEGNSTLDGHPIFVFVFSCKVEDGRPDPEFDEEVLDAEFLSRQEIEDRELRNDIVLKAFEMKENGTMDVENFSEYSHPYLDEDL
ncbi:NUDIX hydrolase [Candidatus Nanosalina sp. VS9-1]|uniref:NUDIX hydrolase n=1 Tax=Candidatus Nanosalina sp. VS9-1 TaxID=3388566 RepID=UPI0039E0A702